MAKRLQSLDMMPLINQDHEWQKQWEAFVISHLPKELTADRVEVFLEMISECGMHPEHAAAEIQVAWPIIREARNKIPEFDAAIQRAEAEFLKNRLKELKSKSKPADILKHLAKRFPLLYGDKIEIDVSGLPNELILALAGIGDKGGGSAGSGEARPNPEPDGSSQP